MFFSSQFSEAIKVPVSTAIISTRDAKLHSHLLNSKTIKYLMYLNIYLDMEAKPAHIWSLGKIQVKLFDLLIIDVNAEKKNKACHFLPKQYAMSHVCILASIDGWYEIQYEYNSPINVWSQHQHIAHAFKKQEPLSCSTMAHDHVNTTTINLMSRLLSSY